MSVLTVTLGKSPASGGAQRDWKFYNRKVEKRSFQSNRMGSKTFLGKSKDSFNWRGLSETVPVMDLRFSNKQ